jgi:hypothetical protein
MNVTTDLLLIGLALYSVLVGNLSMVYISPHPREWVVLQNEAWEIRASVAYGRELRSGDRCCTANT